MNNEHRVQIPARDGKTIHGLFRGDTKDPLIIYVHGLNGWIHEALPQDAARFFGERGFSFLRIELYCGKKNARDFLDVTLRTQANDLDDIVDFYKQKAADNIYVIGHSYGGLTILLSENKQFNKAVLWDPTHLSVLHMREEGKYLSEVPGYLDGHGTYYVIGVPMVEENETIQPEVLESLKTWTIPTLIVSAEAMLLEGAMDYVGRLKDHCPIKHVVIPESSHNFVEEESKKILLDDTLQWLNT